MSNQFEISADMPSRMSRGQRLKEISDRGRRISEQQAKFKALPPLEKGEADRLVAEYIREHGVTKCPVKFVGESEQLATPYEARQALRELAKLVKPKPAPKPAAKPISAATASKTKKAKPKAPKVENALQRQLRLERQRERNRLHHAKVRARRVALAWQYRLSHPENEVT